MPSKKQQEIQEEIAHLLSRDNVGMTARSIIQKVTLNAEPDEITAAIESMLTLGDIQKKGQRITITPIGRSTYSSLYEDNLEPGRTPAAHNAIIPPDPEKQIVTATGFKTSDGKIYAEKQDALHHQIRLHMQPTLDVFFDDQGIGNTQKHLAAAYIQKWEIWKQSNGGC